VAGSYEGRIAGAVGSKLAGEVFLMVNGDAPSLVGDLAESSTLQATTNKTMTMPREPRTRPWVLRMATSARGVAWLRPGRTLLLLVIAAIDARRVAL
jgi:hypothetical protein